MITGAATMHTSSSASAAAVGLCPPSAAVSLVSRPTAAAPTPTAAPATDSLASLLQDD